MMHSLDLTITGVERIKFDLFYYFFLFVSFENFLFQFLFVCLLAFFFFCTKIYNLLG